MNNNPFSLDNKKILVTGASSGIGRSIAIECSKMGATVVITGRNEERLSETYALLAGNDKNHRMICANLSEQFDVEKLISETGSLDGLVLCAGKGLTLPFQFASQEKIHDLFDINFFSPIEIMRLFLKKKLIGKNSSILIISSVGGIRRFPFGNSVYGAAKAALSSMMKSVAREFSHKKIRINCICPGMVDTPLIHKLKITEEQLKEDEKNYPLGRYGKPEDIAYGAIYLLSDASSWITGQDFVIDGGISI